MSEENYSLSDLESDLLDELRDRKEEILESPDSQQLLSEYAESFVPIYYYELAQYLAHNFNLAFEEGYYEEKPDAFRLIQWSISEHLLQVAYEWFETVKGEALEEEETSVEGV